MVHMSPKSSQLDLASIRYNLGDIYQSLGQYTKALEYYQQARIVFESLGLTHLVQMANNRIDTIRAEISNKNESKD